MSTTLEQLFFMDPWELSNKLGQILVTLQHQKQQCKKYFTKNIERMQLQANRKEEELKNLQQKLQATQKKLQYCEWKIIQKDNAIEVLNSRVKNFKKILISRIQHFLDHFDLTIGDKAQIQLKNNEGTNKRINISEYFIQAAESCKVNCNHKNENQLTNYTNQLKKQSTNDSFYSHPITNMLKNQSDKTGKNLETKQSHQNGWKDASCRQKSIKSLSNCIQLNSHINFNNKITVQGKSSQGMKKFLQHYEHICNKHQLSQNKQNKNKSNIKFAKTQIKRDKAVSNSGKKFSLISRSKNSITPTLLQFK